MGFTQQSLADKVQVSRIYIQALESNRRMPSMKLLHRLAEALQATITDIVEEFPNRASRMHLEEILTSGEVDVWFRKRKLTDDELKRVVRVITAVLEDWETENGLEKKPRARKGGSSSA
jgi:transcriptional regulator with XRE-family HTH domain